MTRFIAYLKNHAMEQEYFVHRFRIFCTSYQNWWQGCSKMNMLVVFAFMGAMYHVGSGFYKLDIFMNSMFLLEKKTKKFIRSNWFNVHWP